MQKGVTIWLTGLSGAGKTTISNLLSEKLKQYERNIEVLDGDITRENLSKGLTFSKEDRDINIRRIGFVANLLTRNGVIAIIAAISPYKALRRENRELHYDFIQREHLNSWSDEIALLRKNEALFKARIDQILFEYAAEEIEKVFKDYMLTAEALAEAEGDKTDIGRVRANPESGHP